MSAVIDQKEKLLLEFALSNRELFIKVFKVLNPIYFDPPLKQVLEFSLRYFSEYRNLPLFDIIKVETGVDLTPRDVAKHEFEYVTDEIEKHCRNMAMRLAIINSAEKYLEAADYGAIEQEVRNALMVSVDNNLGLNLFEDPELRLMMMKTNLDGRSIGWPSVDQVIDCIRRGELLLFAGGTGSGKSIMLANVANNMAKDNLNVLYITFELQDSLVAKRCDSIVTGIPNKEIFDDITAVSTALKAIEASYGTFYVKKMPNGTKSNEIRAYLMEYELQFGFAPDVLCVDYLDLMSPNMRIDGNRFDIDKAITEELREICVDFNAYGFTASQLNRDAVDSVVKSQSHIAGGISKLNTVDAALAISRTEEQKDRGEIELQLLKLRNAEFITTPITLYFDSKTLRVLETPPAKSFAANVGVGSATKNKIEALIGKGKK
jgi:hypothetical protein